MAFLVQKPCRILEKMAHGLLNLIVDLIMFCTFFCCVQHEFHRGSRNTRSLVKFILNSLEVNLFDLWEGTV